MCAPNKTKKGNKAFRYLFPTHLLNIDNHICHGIRLLGCRVKSGSFSSSGMNCMSMDSIAEVLYRLNIMLLATKNIADDNLVFQ